MSGSVRLTICAALATLAASSAMLPLVDARGWMVQAVILLAIQSAVGAVARRVPLARPLTVAAQALVALLMLTAVFARREAFLGVLPGPGVFREFGQLLADGGDDVGLYAIPAPLTEGIRLMLVGGVLLIGLVVDALAVTYRSAAPAGLPLLALYSVAAGLADGGRDWLWFLFAAAGYLLLLLAEGRDRLAQWGRVFGGGQAPARSYGGLAPAADGPALAPVRTGRRIGALALGIALAVPAMLPSLGGGLLDRQGSGGGQGDGGGTISAVNPLVSLQNSLNQPENREVLRYNTSSLAPQDMYLRIVALDKFDGASWKPSERRVTEVPPTLPQPPGLARDVLAPEVTTSLSAAKNYAQTWLPLPYPASRVDIRGRWRFEPEGRTLVGDRGQTTKGVSYRVTSLQVQPTATQLAKAPAPPAQLLREYTEVPDSLPPVVAERAREVTAGGRTAYEKAVKLQDWFAVNGGFRYDTEVETGSGRQAIATFLEQKEGFCVHYSFSMAAMARTLGIPARVAVGFTPGVRQADGSYSVGVRDAHAWPELYFEGAGWTRFEPTPTRGNQPDYTTRPVPSEDDERRKETAKPTSPAQGPATPTPKDSCSPQAKKLGDCGAPATKEPEEEAAGGGWEAHTVIGLGALVLLVVVVPLSPMAWRLRTRSRRLGGSGGRTPEDAAERTLAAWRELIDTAWDYGIAPDEAETSRMTVIRVVQVGRLDTAAAEAAHRVAEAVEQVLYAPRPRPVTGLADDVRRVAAGLRATAGRGARLGALLAPRSTVRVVWACSLRWHAFLARWGWGAPRWSRLTALLRRPSRQRG
ncbi:DUF3488 and transglutaminase-like domain-containing protein [Streptomyces sp. SAJ15]|uniref:transglutaminase family protein n=1 Tax=Streptomyces sp. SAJ15 TaxID=2011095 RepID=UPI001186F43D|nr:DUF3488 and transglutaminase-like domain-containing protein [Streptomyces sp. SAJ15]TVL90896.1 transglutaminase [Streptomyces sp. SAJ15]